MRYIHATNSSNDTRPGMREGTFGRRSAHRLDMHRVHNLQFPWTHGGFHFADVECPRMHQRGPRPLHLSCPDHSQFAAILYSEEYCSRRTPNLRAWRRVTFSHPCFIPVASPQSCTMGCTALPSHCPRIPNESPRGRPCSIRPGKLEGTFHQDQAGLPPACARYFDSRRVRDQRNRGVCCRFFQWR